jgi:predicted neuraminidase/peroxiredoxin
MHRFCGVIWIFLLLVFASLPAGGLEIGARVGPVPLTSLEGLQRTMDNYDERRGTVVVFLSARCAVTAKQMSEINKTHERYRTDEVLFVGVVSKPEEDAEEICDFAQRRGTIFPIYRDPEGVVAKQLSAERSPEFFLLDNTGKLLYHGGLYDVDGAASLDLAIQALLKGTSVATAETPVSGTPLDVAGEKTVIDDPYGSMRYYSSFVFDKTPGVAVHHCSTLAEAPNGDLLCLWYAGSYESADDQALYLSRLPKGERQWTKPERVLYNPEQPPGNAVIFRAPNNTVGIVWGRMEQSRPMRRGTGWSKCRPMFRTSHDDGYTWSEDVEIPGMFGTTPRNVPLMLKEGRLALPISGETEEGRGSFLLFLGGDGKTWTPSGFMNGGSQPTVIQRDNGELLSLMRSHPRITMAVSGDAGKTWSNGTATELKNPGSGIAMTKLKSGRVVLVFNDTDQSDRYPLSIIQSTDDGKTWTEQRTLEADWGEFSYPCIIQADDGMIHISYTYRRYTMKHVAFDEGWLIHEERPN